MPDTTELESCWHDQREKDFNCEIPQLLEKVEHALDTSNEPGPEGPLDAVNRALAVVEEIRDKLMSERAFRSGGTQPPDGWDLGHIEVDLAVGLDALNLLIDDHAENELAPTLELIRDRFQDCKNRLAGETSEARS